MARSTAGSGATFFLLSLLDHPDFREEHRRQMTKIGLGGAPVPTAVGDQAEALGISIIRSYGSHRAPVPTGATRTSQPTSGSTPTADRWWGWSSAWSTTRGRPSSPVGRARSDPRLDLFAGYTDPALTAEAVDTRRLLPSGDVGVLDPDGWLVITDRRKDIIIRGGENVSPAEVEEQLRPPLDGGRGGRGGGLDDRLGEHGCAFIRTHADAPAPRLEDVRACLDQAGLARQVAEEVRIVDDFRARPRGRSSSSSATGCGKGPETAPKVSSPM